MVRSSSFVIRCIIVSDPDAYRHLLSAGQPSFLAPGSSTYTCSQPCRWHAQNRAGNVWVGKSSFWRLLLCGSRYLSLMLPSRPGGIRATTSRAAAGVKEFGVESFVSVCAGRPVEYTAVKCFVEKTLTRKFCMSWVLDRRRTSKRRKHHE